jgi:hypothetical protein
MRNLQRFLLIAATLAAASIADAKPRKVVVLDFDGPRALADTGRSNVMSLLGDQYDVVATKRWESARAQASGHGPQQWQQAARQSGVDAVIEGWVQDEGHHHTLTIAVRDASTGTEIDTFSVKLGDKGVTTDGSRLLASQLDDVLAWIDGDPMAAGAGAQFPDVRTVGPMLGAHQVTRPDHSDDADDDDDDGDDRPARHHRKHHHHRAATADDDGNDRAPRHHARDDDRDHDRDRGDSKDRDSKDRDSKDRDSKDDAKTDAPKPEPKKVAALDATQDTNDLIKLFGPDSKEADIVSEAKPPRLLKPAPKIMISAGGFVASRGMTFEQNPPDSKMSPPEYPASGMYGISLAAAVYPLPVNKLDTRPSGVGFSFGLEKSVGAYLSAYDPVGNTYGDYTLDHTAYEGAIHYRYPIDIVSFDGEVNYGKFGNTFSELPIQIPDTEYQYVGLGGHIEVNITDRTRVGFGAKYMYLLSAGDVSDETWYGAGTSSGLALDASVQIPIGDLLYLKGELDYRRVSLDFEQSGDVSNNLDISRLVDSTIGGTLQLGVAW